MPEGNKLPQDPAMLLSFVNTQLRDPYETLQDLCAAMNVDEAGIREKLAQIDYEYDEAQRRFI